MHHLDGLVLDAVEHRLNSARLIILIGKTCAEALKSYDNNEWWAIGQGEAQKRPKTTQGCLIRFPGCEISLGRNAHLQLGRPKTGTGLCEEEGEGYYYG